MSSTSLSGTPKPGVVEVRLETRIRRPAAEVFAFLTHVDNFAKWQEGIAGIEQLDPGPWHAGTRIRTVHKFLIWNSLVDYSEIVSLEHNVRFRNQGKAGSNAYREEFLLENEGDGIRLKYSADITPGGIFIFIKSISAWAFRSQMQRSFARLKILLEQSEQQVATVADASAI